MACTEGLFSSSSPPPTPRCNLQITGASIQYNGQALPLPGSMETWQQVLGAYSRKVETADDVYVWDQVGIHAFTGPAGPGLQGFFVLLQPRSSPDRPAPGYWPRAPFKGQLCVDGSRITSATSMDEVNRDKLGQKFSKGYLESIYSYDLVTPMAVYVRIDLTDNARPESFSMSLAGEAPPSPDP